MIEPGSWIGFALVFIASTWLASALLVGALWRARDRLRKLGPRAERRAASIALALPVGLGAVLTAGLAGFSLLGPSFGVADHCLDHDHHLHLCLRHGASWLYQWWAVALTSGIAALLAIRVGSLGYRWWRSGRRLRALRQVSSQRELADGTVVVCAPSRQRFCFTAGVRSPRIYLGSAALDELTAGQQAAMIAHEQAHIAFGDLWRGGALSMLSLLGAPRLAAWALCAWRDAGERLCDRAAADAVGSPETVASAIVSFARAPTSSTGLAFIPRPDQVVERVEAVLADIPYGDDAARGLGALAGLVLLSGAVAAALSADPLHHAIETLLGSL